MLYCFQEFLLLILAFPGSIAVCLKAEIKEEPCNSVIARAEGHSMVGGMLKQRRWGESRCVRNETQHAVVEPGTRRSGPANKSSGEKMI